MERDFVMRIQMRDICQNYNVINVSKENIVQIDRLTYLASNSFQVCSLTSDNKLNYNKINF